MDSSLKCLWMLAGVVDYRLCAREYDCEGCPFDRAIHGSAFGRLPSARASASSEACPATVPAPATLSSVDPDSTLPRDVFYDRRHLWGRVEAGARVRVGLGAFAQRLLGRAYAVRLPEVGARVSAGEPCWFVAHRAGETSLGVPVDGVVCERNERLVAEPSLLNRDPYGLGHVFSLEPTNLVGDLRRLAYGPTARTIEARDTELFGRLVAEASGTASLSLGPTLADGGQLVADPLRDLSVEQVEGLIKTFLTAPSGERSPVLESPLSSPNGPRSRRKGV